MVDIVMPIVVFALFFGTIVAYISHLLGLAKVPECILWAIAPLCTLLYLVVFALPFLHLSETSLYPSVVGLSQRDTVSILGKPVWVGHDVDYAVLHSRWQRHQPQLKGKGDVWAYYSRSMTTKMLVPRKTHIFFNDAGRASAVFTTGY